MMRTSKIFPSRWTASLLTGALIALSPGPGAYEAAAAIIRVPTNVAAPGVGGAASAGGIGIGTPGTLAHGIGNAGSLELTSFAALPGVDAFKAGVPETAGIAAQSVRALPSHNLPIVKTPVEAKTPKAGSETPEFSPESADAIENKTREGKAVRRGFKRIFRSLGWGGKKAESVPEGAFTEKPASGLAPAAKKSGKARAALEDGGLEAHPAPDSDHLVFDIHEGYFRAGYVAASVWTRGTSLELPKSAKRFGRTKDKERRQFIGGLAYRIAELRKDESAGQRFLKRAEKASDDEINPLLDKALEGLETEHPALRENLSDADYVQGYLTGTAWRPGKQLMMPAPSLRQRLMPGLRKKMKGRDERFMEGLYASLEGREGSPAALLREKLSDAPAVGTRDFATALGYQLTEVLTPLYDKGIEEGLPYLPGKIRIPRSLLGLVVGHMIFIMFGIYMHVSAQPYLVYGLTGSKTMMGVIRNVHFGAYSASSFLPIGPSIDKTDFRTMFIWTSVVRALLMGLIPLLFFSGYMTFAVLIGIVAVNPVFQSLMTNSDTAARDSFLGRDENMVREGNAFATKVSAIGGLVIPAAAAWVVSQFVVAFGNPGGYAAAYAGYGIMLLVSIPVFMFMVRDPRYYDPSIKQKPSKNPLNIFVPVWIVIRAPYRAVYGLFSKIAKGFGRVADRAPDRERAAVLADAEAREIPFEKGRRMKNIRETLARFFDKIEATQGVSVILRSETLSLLVVITAIELFIADALMFVLIPNYIIDVIRPQAALAAVPVIGSMLATPVGIMGIMLTAAAVGRYLGSRWASGPKGARRIKKWGHKTLYRAAALSGLTFWGMLIPTFFVAPVGAGAAAAMSIPLFAGSLAVLVFSEFMISLLATPLGIAMSPVRRKQIPNDMVGKVSAAFTMVDVGLMAAGALAIGLLIDMVPIQTAVAVIAIAITMTSILEWFAPNWLKKINPEGWEHGEKSGPSGK